MKTISTTLIAILFLLTINVRAAKYEITKANSEGFTVTIESVVSNLDSSHTITLRVANNGRNSFSCQELSRLSIEALPRTYSDVNLSIIYGAISYDQNIAATQVGVDPFQGFKYNGFKNLGRDKSGAFKVTYTIKGNLQNQRVCCSTGISNWTVRFNAKDFENVRDINNIDEDNISKKNNKDSNCNEKNTVQNRIIPKLYNKQYDFSTINEEALAVENINTEKK